MRACTGRQHLLDAPAQEAWVVVGRRGGKSRVAALAAVFLACFRDYAAVLAPGERGTIMLIAADRKQARVLMRYVTGLLESVPMLARLVASRTGESIALRTRIDVEIHTASFRAVRGYTVVAAIADEVAFWKSEDSANPDVEILNGLRPGLATVPGSLLLAISSPYARRGALWEAHRQHFGKDGDPILVWQADTRTMNPRVDEQIIAEAYAADEATAKSEWGGLFRADLEDYVSPEVVGRLVIRDRCELPPTWQPRYVAFCDPAGGSGGDSMTVAIAHAAGAKVVLDVVTEARPPFSPEAVVERFAAMLKGYQVRTVVGDRFGGDWPAERFRTHGISYAPADKPKSAIYGELLPLLNSHVVELLDDRRLVAQLLALERRTAWGGRDSVDHPPGGNDDVINAAAGALVLAWCTRRGRGLPIQAGGTGGITITMHPELA